MNPSPGDKYYRVVTNPKDPEDYIPPVAVKGGPILDLISDESAICDMLCVSLIVMPTSDELRGNTESDLENLVDRYGLSAIHFSDIFGRKKMLGNRTENFLTDYCEIVSTVKMVARALCRDKDELLRELGETEMEQELLYFQLFWNNFHRILPALLPHSVVHIWWEQEHNLSVNLGKRLIRKLYSGIWGIDDEGLNGQVCSICRHPFFFSKRALFFSSASDLAAYVTNKVSFSLWKGVPEKNT